VLTGEKTVSASNGFVFLQSFYLQQQDRFFGSQGEWFDVKQTLLNQYLLGYDLEYHLVYSVCKLREDYSYTMSTSGVFTEIHNGSTLCTPLTQPQSESSSETIKPYSVNAVVSSVSASLIEVVGLIAARTDLDSGTTESVLTTLNKAISLGSSSGSQPFEIPTKLVHYDDGTYGWLQGYKAQPTISGLNQTQTDYAGITSFSRSLLSGDPITERRYRWKRITKYGYSVLPDTVSADLKLVVGLETSGYDKVSLGTPNPIGLTGDYDGWQPLESPAPLQTLATRALSVWTPTGGTVEGYTLNVS
jgi:hypothetical protein